MYPYNAGTGADKPETCLFPFVNKLQEFKNQSLLEVPAALAEGLTLLLSIHIEQLTTGCDTKFLESYILLNSRTLTLTRYRYAHANIIYKLVWEVLLSMYCFY